MQTEIYSTVNGITLRADIYTPQSTTPTPAIILAHGGGFFRGSRKEKVMLELSGYFLKAGFCVASIDYRLSLPSRNAIEQAGQDLAAAIRYIRANAEKYNVNPDQINSAGTSAGAFAALAAAYMEPTDFHPYNLNNSNPGYSSEVKAVANFWGGILSLNYLEQGEAAVINIYGDADKLVNINYGNTFGTNCYGGKAIFTAAKSEGIITEEKVFSGYGHGLSRKAAGYADRIQEAATVTTTFFSEV